MEIRVEWERVVQTKPFESLRIRLGVIETVLLPDEKQGSVIGPSSVPVVARAAAEFERVFFESLAKIGEQLIVEELGRIQSPTVSKPSASPPPASDDAESLFPYDAPPSPKPAISGARRR